MTGHEQQLDRDQEPPRSLVLIRDGELVNRPKPAALIAKVLLENTFAPIVGESAAGKTFLEVATGMSIATGLRWFGHEVVRCGPVIAVVAEGVGMFDSRVLAWKHHHHQPIDQNLGFAYVSGEINLLDRDAVARFADEIEAEQPVAIFFDTWARMLAAGGGDEDKAKDVSRAVANCGYLQSRLKCAVLPLHHAGWEGSRERGSSALRAAADTTLFVKKADDLITVTAMKQRDVPEDLCLTLRRLAVPEHHSCVLRIASEVVHTEDLTTQQHRALRALHEHFPSAGATAKELTTATGIPTASAYRVFEALEQRGLVRKAGQRYVLTGLELAS
jgi:hypothetical protein